MKNTLLICRAMVACTLLETIRRKDLYVVLVLTILMTAGAWMFGFFGVHGLEIFIKDVAFTAIGAFSTVLAVMLSARQIPEEIQRRTIYPLMARPVSRWQLLLGKWAGASLASILGFAMLFALALLLLMTFGIGVPAIAWQYAFVKAAGLCWLCGMVVALSVYMTASANITLCLILAFGSAAFTRFTLLLNATSPISSAWFNVLYGALPHYDLFDLSGKVTYAWAPIPLWVVGSLMAYSLAGCGLWLSLGWLRFRKQAI
jgi:Cu-processing system permease protein